MKSNAENVSMEKGITLDQIQYISYEMVCSMFLLNLLNDGQNKNSDMSNFAVNDDDLNDETTNNIKRTGRKIHANWC